MADENSGQRSASPQESMTNVPDNSSGGSFPFLVHSQDTLQNNFAPKIDNHPLARQKRRRTRYAMFLKITPKQADSKHV